MATPYRSSPAWTVLIASLATAAVEVASHDRILRVTWPVTLVATVVAVAVAFLTTAMQSASSGADGWGRIGAWRIGTAVALGAWATWTSVSGWSPIRVGILAGITLALGTVAHACPVPRPVARPALPPAPADRRHQVVREWQAWIRTVTGKPFVVNDWEPWDVPADGLRLFADIPVGASISDLVLATGKLAEAARLPHGCAVRIGDGDRQGEVVIDVMLRNTLATVTGPHYELALPASVNDAFPVLTTPRGEQLSIRLRIESMIVGGAVGSGKTTLLHRIIMWLARCVDALVWVADLNGGGIAEPWILPWAQGRATAPVVDWVADTEAEAAIMVAVASAIARDRKTNPAASTRRRTANSTVLPVDQRMPAIIVLTDEGGEVRRSVSLLGQLAGAGITRLAEIGRAEGVRVIMSVLRGTSDLLEKSLRKNAGLRMCLRMNEHDEYGYVLGDNPGKVRLTEIGSGFLKTPDMPVSVLGRTVDVDLNGMDAHAVACGVLRPKLDEHGLRVAARVTVRDAVGREPAREIARLRAMRDVSEGRAYTGRWDRYAGKLAAMRGEEWDEETFDEPDETPAVVPSGALAAWSAAVHRAVPTPATTAQSERQQADTAREQILALVRSAGTKGVTAAEIERGVTVGHTRVFGVMRELRDDGTIQRNDVGRYVTADARVES